ncbi:MAG: NAD(P)H-dependent oxidoreductase, partial [Planctomycetes bacterium]|nr:NAD(P)H-dependent oxidoreductase [Planctomycetota bacterium]
MSTPKVLAFAGSIRKDSFNKQLAKVAMDCAEELGADVTFVDLHDYQLPLYCGDLHEANGIPENALAFKELMKSHNGFLISSPEYNGSLTGILKNTIDWATMSHGDEERMACFNGKIAGLMCAAPGVGGSRGLHHLRMVLSSLGTFVLPKHVNVTNCHAHL